LTLTRRTVVAVTLVAATLGPAAGFEIAPLVSRTATGLDYDEAALDTLVGDLGAAARPGLGGPSSTVGALGFTFGYQLAHTPLGDSDAWSRASRGDAPRSLTASELFVRKGLPMSLELGAAVAFFHDLDIQVASFELKWAFVEGLGGAPDIGARLHLSGVLGHPDLTVVSTGADLTIGKGFGLGGALRLSPYAGYAFAFHHGIPRPVGVVLPGDVGPTTAILPASNLVTHRGLIGLEIAFTYTSLAFEASLGEVSTLTLRIGAAL